MRRRRLEAEQLLDRVGNEPGVVRQLAPLVGMLREHLPLQPIKPRRRLVPRAGHDRDVREDLLAREPAHRSRFVLELGEEHLGHEVVGRVVGAPVDVVAEDGTGQEVVLRVLHGLARFGSQRRIDVLADLVLVLLRDTEEHADHPHRHLRAEVRHEVEPAGADERVEARRAQLPDLGFECVHLLRGENPREQ